MDKKINNVCVYCASSTKTDKRYTNAARLLGEFLAKNNVAITYGGGAVGSMGALAEGALSENGTVTGVIPEFMYELEWGKPDLTNLKVVPDIHIRKRTMLENADAVIALPGGSGTLEELLEAITWKRLGLYTNPIILVNIAGFYAPLIQMLNHSIDERFMDQRHREMWSVVEDVEHVLDAIQSAPAWDSDARRFAAI